MSYQINKSIIRAYLNDDEILAQMAEEASELAQACLKLRRAIGDDNPTPVSKQQAIKSLAEEWADVLLCESLLQERYRPSLAASVQDVVAFKAQRWADRLFGVRSTEREEDPYES